MRRKQQPGKMGDSIMVKRILITGVYGLIGNVVYRELTRSPEAYDVYGLSRRQVSSDRIPEDQTEAIPDDHFYLVNLNDFDGLQQAVQGMDVVVHMAADPSGNRGFESILQSNLIGAYNVFEVCRLQGVKRIVYASSIQVSFGYWDTEPYKTLRDARFDDVEEPIPRVTIDMPTRPLNLYASSKVWGEALAHTYAYRYGLSCLCLRIGWVVAEDRPPIPRAIPEWCSQRDIVQLVRRCVDAPDTLRFDIFYGLSHNRFGWVDIEHARQVLDYNPLDSAEDKQ
jgi:nucleoside-diphosphate-sugar epimerase